MAGSGVFISYRRQDSQSAAGRLADGLELRFGKAQIFRDVETIQPGVDFVDAIETALSSCSVMLAVIGRRWKGESVDQNRLLLANDWIRLEIAAALKRGVRVIPVLVEGALPPAETDLPDDIKSLARRQTHTLSDERWDYDVQQLALVLESVGVHPLKAAGSTADTGTNTLQSRSRTLSSRLVKTLAWIGGIFVGLIVLGLMFQESSTPNVPLQPYPNPVASPLPQAAPSSAGWGSGTPTSACGCWGYAVPGYTQPNPQCMSGYHAVAACPGMCAAGGYQWQAKCT